ncbi:MAG: GMC family oxidoreductase N-terminal domain-containing protein [Sphingopyxis sp.]|uniref:GMC family oxidoreductase n=1 Tax=Sphingopyxis sp. TaxID=1908224 RepID=UPI002ABB3A5F|nr:GMC family oxidoreductase N-terminal domain-containing protein [Sphingopyxis sp.]MDZ3830878.1 GMC family oxidoreductase N-terminal domain-containing protein [Sphingopyxis sp.]
MSANWDYIIVGAGSAGCVVAEQLSAAPGIRVLLLEAGGPNDSRWVAIPKGVAKLVTNPDHIWAYGVSQPRGDGAAVGEVWIRGKGLGGSSAVNGMIWSRGEPADYDEWERLGCTGWNGEAMTDAFRRLEDHGLGASSLRGAGGPVGIAPKIFTYPLAETMVQAGIEMGLQPVDDLNAATSDRVGFYAHNIRRGRRESAATTFLARAARRPNLRVVTGALAERLIVEGGRVIGIEARVAGRPQRFNCSGEVILSGGALESPLLLQRSGIGAAEVLRTAGVDPIVDVPDVGGRLREHLGFSMPHRLSRDVGSNRSFFGIGLMRAMAQYMLTRGGIMATGPFEVGAFLNLTSGDLRPDIQLYLGGYTFALGDDKHPVPLSSIDRQPGITIYGQLLRLTSEGSIHITGPGSDAAPDIRPNWLSTEADERTAIAAVHAMRRYMAQPALAGLIERELLPGATVQGDAEILAAFRRLATCGLHAVGTCRMGSDNRAVTDARLRVNGIGGLRVVDCSVIPSPVTGNTNAPAMALALRAAGLIREDRRRLRGSA